MVPALRPLLPGRPLSAGSVLTARDLNRAVLARQLLLRRSPAPVPRALELVAGIQAQYAPSTYVGLWSRVAGFRLADLTRALEERRAVQATLMRSTIHVVSARDYWLFAEGLRRARREWWTRTHGRRRGADVERATRAVGDALAVGPRRREELVAMCRPFDPSGGDAAWQGLALDLVRVPPSGTWERRRADLYATAESWLGPSTAAEEAGLEHLLRRYLAGFGPARLADAADWAGVPVGWLKPVAERLRLRSFRDEDGRPLLDLPRAPLPGRGAAAPVRFLPTWDATLLVHARRARILPEEYRPHVFTTRNPQSVSTFLVDGAVAGTWRVERAGTRATLAIAPFAPLPRAARSELRDEASGLVRLVEPGALTYAATGV